MDRDELREIMNYEIEKNMRRVAREQERICLDAAIALAASDGEHGPIKPRTLLAHQGPKWFAVDLVSEPLPEHDFFTVQESREIHDPVK